MLEGKVLLAFIRQPMTLPDGQRYFVLELQGDDDREHRLLSWTQPDIFGPDGQPMVLAVEIGPGSSIKVDHRERIMRAIQVLDHKTINPFL
jgi:hypothetical protein